MAGSYFINRAVLREVTVAKLQSDFVASVSHEFRTPLTTVRQLSEMLARGRVSSDERRQQFYETLLRESERLHRLVEGLLNFGRMEAGELHYRFEPVDLATT
jgi:signal transduction histidine kinase